MQALRFEAVRQNQLTALADQAFAPVVGPNDTVFFMRSSAELWKVERDRQPRPVVKAFSSDGSSELERMRSWVMQPRLSPSGRFLLAQLTAIRKTATAEVAIHDAVVVDLRTHRVQHVPAFLEHTIAGF